MQIVLHLLRGVAIGLANIIPGVSGGTMALVLGIYGRLIKAIRNIGSKTFTCVFRGKEAFIEEMKRIDAVMIGAILIGALAAVVGSAKLLVYLLNKHHDPTYGFFFGLVIVSVVVPYRMIKKVSPSAIIAGLLGISLVVGVTVGLSGEKRVESARQKAAMKAAKAKAKAGAIAASDAKTAAKKTEKKEKTKKYSVPVDGRSVVLFLIAGAVAISAMILPGISGSFVLLLMGVYFDVLACINERNFVLLGIFALGCLVGVAVFSRLINFALERFHDATLAFLAGLVVGSLYAIWPFKSFAIVAGQRVDKANILPAGFGGNEIVTVATVIAGAAIVGVFVWIEIKQEKRRAQLEAEASSQSLA